jgi:hypothetical protein
MIKRSLRRRTTKLENNSDNREREPSLYLRDEDQGERRTVREPQKGRTNESQKELSEEKAERYA